MQVTLDLPDDISAVLEGCWPDLPRQALEALAVEAYRTGALPEGPGRRPLPVGAGRAAAPARGAGCRGVSRRRVDGRASAASASSGDAVRGALAPQESRRAAAVHRGGFRG